MQQTSTKMNEIGTNAVADFQTYMAVANNQIPQHNSMPLPYPSPQPDFQLVTNKTAQQILME